MTNRVFGMFAAAHVVSVYGTYLNLVALSLFTWNATGSAIGTGAIMALRLVSGFLAGLTAGAVNHRFSRRSVMIWTDLAQTVAMVVLALNTGVVVLCVTVVVLGSGNTLFTVALRSSVPDLVGQENRLKANGLLVVGRSFATVLGFASAGIIVPAAGYPAAFLINAGSFVVSAAAAAALPGRPTGGSPTDTSPKVQPVSALKLLSPMLIGLILVRGADALGSASHNVALPIYADTIGSLAFMSQFMTAWAVGCLVAHPVARRWSGRSDTSTGAVAFAVGTCLMSVSFVVAFTGLSAPMLIAVAFTAGLADGFTEITYVTRLQVQSDANRDRVFGLSASVETAGMGSGMVLAAATLEAFRPVAVVALFHGVAFVAATAFLLTLVRRQHTWRST